MRLEHLDYFMKVVECGSISGAASALFISPQGLSQAVQQLERELSVSLFYRERNRLRLTAAGETTYQAASEILSINQRLRQQLQRGQTEARETPDQLTILASPVVNMTFLPKAVNLYLKRNPGVSVRVMEVSAEGLLQQLHEKPAEPHTIPIFALPWTVFESVIRDKPVALDFFELLRCPIQGCVSTKSDLAERTLITKYDLLSHPIVIYNMDEFLLRTLFPHTEFSNIALRTSNLGMCRSIIASSNYGIALTNEVIERYVKNALLCTVPLDCEEEMVYGYMLAPEASSIPAVADMVTILTQLFSA